MELMSDQRTRPVTAVHGPQELSDPRVHRTQVIRRLLAAGISGTTLCAIVPEWSGTITCLDEERQASTARGVPVG